MTTTQVLTTGALIIGAVLTYALLSKKRTEQKYQIVTLKNNGIELHVSALGAIIHKLIVPSAKGKKVDVALGHATLEEYLTSGTYFGSVCGRSANRIAGATYSSGEATFKLSQNDGSNHLHGGFHGWDKKVWALEEFNHEDGPAVKLSLESQDGDEGYPGNVSASVTYILQFNKSVKAVFEASTDKETPINIVQHCYFNLGGHESGKILDHTLQVNATHYTPKDNNNAGVIPTGEIVPIAGTPFDFSGGKPIGKDFDQLEGGYDHNFILFGNAKKVKEVKLSRAKERPEFAALLHSPKTGISMQVSTTAPGLQVYTGGFLSDVKGKEGVVYQAADGVCLETQGFPNAVNEPKFPSALVQPGEKYHHEVVYQFSSS